MSSSEPMKPNVKQEPTETDDDVVEILPRRAVTPNGGGFSVIIRDTSELTAADVQFVKPFLRRPTVEPTTDARFNMKEVPTTGGWEIVIEDTSTLTSTHMRSVIDVIASREQELRGRPQRQQQLPEQQGPVAARVQRAASSPQVAASVAGNFAAASPPPPAKKRQKPQKNPNAPKYPLNAYFWFLKENRHRWTKPGKHPAEVTKAAGIAWAALSEKEKERWYELAAKDKERYDREMAEYQRETRNL